MDYLKVRGAKQHNLKSLNLDLPKNKLIVFTGISGSGKSSLAFDTIYAEGQRRYVESLSSYARQFLGVMDKPNVELIEGLSPAISIDQKQPSKNPRSTVGTVTEIYDYLRLLYARVGHPHCPQCNSEIKRMSKEEITASIKDKFFKKRPGPSPRLLILAPLVRDRKGDYSSLFTNLRKQGYSQTRVDGQIINLSDPPVLIKTNRHTIELVIDRLVLGKSFDKVRLNEAIESALKLAEGQVIVSEVLDASLQMPQVPKKFRDWFYSEKFSCLQCNLGFPEMEPRNFSFNSPHGACTECDGLATKLIVDQELILAPELTISEGGVIPLATSLGRDTWMRRILSQVATGYGFDLKTPIKSLTKNQTKVLLYGTSQQIYRVEGRNRHNQITTIYEVFEGVIPLLQRRYQETESDHVRTEIEKFMRVEICPKCQGKRLKPLSLGVTITNKNISQVAELSISHLDTWIKKLNNHLTQREKKIAAPIIKELTTRVSFLLAVGLNYLTIDRVASTLAGGEAQRIRLASQIGTGLSGVLYVLDEPSVGLHARDQRRLIQTLKDLRDLGNTVIVVEHDRDTIMAADWIVDFGPGAGEAGGWVVVQGSPEKIKKTSNSLTGQFLSGRKKVKPKTTGLRLNQGELILKGVRHHNLKNLTVKFPLGKFICVTGVSGSGKSSLVEDVLYRALGSKFYRIKEKPGEFDQVLGEENLDKVVLVDQSPIGRTPRSNPATYTGAFTPIRTLFAHTKEARVRGYSPSRFSFNLKGGRCEACRGEGQLKIEMQFLPDVYVTCEVCQGLRYSHETLEIEYKVKNITEVLKMSVGQAWQHFENVPLVLNKLDTLKEVGLGYIKLGQPAPTLSGGEAQRVKLATELSKRQTGKTLYLLDEPTTGLHFADLEKLLNVLFKLVSYGNTIVVIEHNLEVIKNADWIIDLGPEGGEDGGEIVAQGPPAEVALSQNSHTGKVLKDVLKD